MFEWSNLYATHIESIDTQHRMLFEMINRIAAEMEGGNTNDQNLEKAFDEVVEYANNHFIDEEMIMAQNRVDPRHLALQRMEHKSFIYDANRMREYSVSDSDLREGFEKLLRFVTSWLIYHTLRTDQQMAFQIAEIKAGKSPAAAFEAANRKDLNPAIYRQVVDALLHLWTDAIERLARLEGTAGDREINTKQ